MKNYNPVYQSNGGNFGIALMTLGLILFCCFQPIGVIAQEEKVPQWAQSYLDANARDFGFNKSDISDVAVTDAYRDEHNGLSHIYLRQQYNGIEITGGVMGIHYKTEDEVLHVGNRFYKKLDGRIHGASPTLTAEQAIEAAATALGLPVTEVPKVLEQTAGPAQEQRFTGGAFSRMDIPVKLAYQPVQDGTFRLAWQVQVYTLDAQHYWVVAVDAVNGKILDKQDLVIRCSFENCSLDHGKASGAAHQFFHLGRESAIGEDEEYAAFAQSSPLSGNYYRVFDVPVETPNHGGRSLIVTNGYPVASPYGWHYDGNIQYTITRGNNVYAYEDQSGANAGTPAVGGITPLQPLNFDFPLNLSQQPSAYKDAAVTNLFYWNNKVHDILYHYGFTEAAGNFQQDNLGKGGIGGDAIMAEAQDGGGTNNANFLTLPDGVPGRMQMYLWSSNAPAELVHIESSATYPAGGVSFTAIQAAFGAAVDESGVEGQLVIVEANANSSSSCSSCGCGTGQGVGLPPANDVSGKVVLIDRGDCSFIEKVMGVQMAGAAGVIVANNIPGAGPLAMGGDETGNLITIPAVMVSYEDGLELKDEIALGTVVIALRRLEPAPPLKDGDLDNGIIAHEYGHGVSIRLTGGPNALNCLSGEEQAGEGWSDFFALMLTMPPSAIADAGNFGRGIGTYVFDEPVTGNGIRPARYSRDLTANPYTYADINNPEITVPHGIGFVFCSALWELAWNLIDVYGYDEDLINGSGGNNLAIQLVIDGLKLQPCAPTFLDSRDAILAADMALTGGANQCLIWEAFAKRGMGWSAASGTNARGDEMEAFDLPPTCADNLSMKKSVSRSLVENGGLLAYTLTVTNNGGNIVRNVRISDPLPEGVNYVSGSASNGGKLKNNAVSFPSFHLSPGQSATRTFQVNVATPGATDLQFYDDMEDGINQWTPVQGINMWTHTQGDAHSGNFSWFAADPDNYSNQILMLASGVALPAGAQLRFWHKFETEASFDGGVVELSDDDGLTWYDLGALMTQNGYNDFIPLANNSFINGFAFGGSSGGWIETIADLSSFSNRMVLVRFRLASDVLTPGTGWWVDDVGLMAHPTFVHNTASFTTAQGQSGQASARTLVVEEGAMLRPAETTPGVQISTAGLDAALEQFELEAYPNPARDIIRLHLTGNLHGRAQLLVLNAQGKVVMERAFQDAETLNAASMDVSGLPAGLYWFSLRSKAGVQTARVVVE